MAPMSPLSPFAPKARLKDRSSGPLYRQLTQHLRQSITHHNLPAGHELPTEAQLAQSFGVSLITVRQALRDLEADGLIRKRAAKAAVVATTNPRPRPSHDLNSLADLVAITAGSRLEIASWRVEQSVLAREVFNLAANEPCPCLRARLIVQGVPQASIVIHFPPAICSRLRRRDFDDVVVFRSVQRRLGIHYAGARITVRAECADARLARLLDCEPGSAILVNQMVYLSSDKVPMELTVARHRADLYSVSYALEAGSF
jgi:GntR family transcriptional regulator